MPKEKSVTIYKIELIETGECYIGSTHQYPPSKRFAQHRSELNKNIRHKSYFQEIWNKNSSDLFLFEIIETINECSVEKRYEREQYWIDNTNSVFNTSRFAFCSMHDPKVSQKNKQPKSEEHKQKLRLAKLGVPNSTYWINNGIISQRFSKNMPIPKGFKRGRLVNWKGGEQPNQNIWITNGIKDIKHNKNEPLPIGFYKGRSFVPWNKNTKGLQIAWNKGLKKCQKV